MAINIDEQPIISLDEFLNYYKSNLDDDEQLEIQRIILVAQDKLLADNNTGADLLSALQDDTVSESDREYLKKAMRHLVRYYFEEGIDKQGSSVSINVGSKNINRSQDGVNFLPQTYFDLYAKTEYYTDDEFIDFDTLEEAAEDTEFTLASSRVKPDTAIKPDEGINPYLLEARAATEAIEILQDDVDDLDTRVSANEIDIAENEAKINALTGQIKPAKEIIASGTEGILPEGAWTTVEYSNIKDNFEGIVIMNNGSIILSAEIENLRYGILGQSNNTGANKQVAFRLWNVTTGEQVGNERVEQIQQTGILSFSDVLGTLAAGEYRIEVFTPTAGGNITFDNYKLDIFTLGTGAGAVVSSQLVNDKDENPDDGINPDLIKIDTKTDNNFETDESVSKITYFTNGTGPYIEYDIKEPVDIKQLRIQVINRQFVIRATDQDGNLTPAPIVDDRAIVTKKYVDDILGTIALELGIEPERIKELIPKTKEEE